jgi:uncharacterized protein
VSWETALALFVAGTVASILGGLVGLGGGFVVIPILRLFFGIPPAEVAGTSLVLVLANTASSTVGFFRHGQVDLKLAWPFVVGAVPASILGVVAVRQFSAAGFDIAYGCTLVGLSILVLRRRATSIEKPVRKFVRDPRIGVAGGLLMGFFSSVFGIGGGIVMVPLLLLAGRMPPLVVAATSAFVVTTTAPIGIIGHAVVGDVDWAVTLPLVLGGILGGGVAPSIGKRMSSPMLITLLAIALIAAAISLIARHVPMIPH